MRDTRLDTLRIVGLKMKWGSDVLDPIDAFDSFVERAVLANTYQTHGDIV